MKFNAIIFILSTLYTINTSPLQRKANAGLLGGLLGNVLGGGSDGGLLESLTGGGGPIGGLLNGVTGGAGGTGGLLGGVVGGNNDGLLSNLPVAGGNKNKMPVGNGIVTSLPMDETPIGRGSSNNGLLGGIPVAGQILGRPGNNGLVSGIPVAGNILSDIGVGV